MRFMLIRKADKETEAGAIPSPQVLADMGKYMDEMGKAGIVLGSEATAEMERMRAHWDKKK